MENTSYALHIAVGVLIAIMITSLTVFFWRKFGIMEKAKDDSQEIKNRSAFNAEYQAYEKNLMYGSDVLSCLNKAQNNNQKYVYNNYYGQDTETIGKDAREEYFIDVVIELKSSLYDSIKAYYRDNSGKYQRAVGLSSEVKDNYNDKVFADANVNRRFEDKIVYYYYFKQGKLYQDKHTYTEIMWKNSDKNKTLYDLLQSGQIETKIEGGKVYHLLTSEDSTTTAHMDDTAKLAALISTVNLNEQKLINYETPSVFTKDDWWYCTWKTAASDFKSRKFKCTGVEFNKNTGYINKITFIEK